MLGDPLYPRANYFVAPLYWPARILRYRKTRRWVLYVNWLFVRTYSMAVDNRALWSFKSPAICYPRLYLIGGTCNPVLLTAFHFAFIGFHSCLPSPLFLCWSLWGCCLHFSPNYNSSLWSHAPNFAITSCPFAANSLAVIFRGFSRRCRFLLALPGFRALMTSGSLAGFLYYTSQLTERLAAECKFKTHLEWLRSRIPRSQSSQSLLSLKFTFN